MELCVLFLLVAAIFGGSMLWILYEEEKREARIRKEYEAIWEKRAFRDEPKK